MTEEAIADVTEEQEVDAAEESETFDFDEDDGLLLEEDTVGNSYGVLSEDESVTGKLFDFPNLGADVKVRVAKLGNPRFQEALAAARKKWGAKKADKKRGIKVGDVPPRKQADMLSAVYAKTIWLGFEGRLYFGGKPLGKRILDRDGQPLAEFTVDDEGYCADVEVNRRTLLRRTWPSLADDLHDLANDDENFGAEAEVEAVRGN